VPPSKTAFYSFAWRTFLGVPFVFLWVNSEYILLSVSSSYPCVPYFFHFKKSSLFFNYVLNIHFINLSRSLADLPSLLSCLPYFRNIGFIFYTHPKHPSYGFSIFSFLG
jgi:hypothetical protein